MCVCVCECVGGWVGVRYALKPPPSHSPVHSCIVLSSDNSVTWDTSEQSMGKRERETQRQTEGEKERVRHEQTKKSL